MTRERELPETETYSPLMVGVSAVLSVIVAALLIWAFSGFGVFHEELFRVSPTVEQGGVGADWETGNQIAWLDFLIAFIHAADVIMGVFILLMMFIHWASFRRLAGHMRQPGETRRGDVAADGGRESPEPKPEGDHGSAVDGPARDEGGERR